MSANDLATICGYCTRDRLTDWKVIPDGDYGTDLLVGLVDGSVNDEPPAAQVLPHMYRAVFTPDARIGLGWGMRSDMSGIKFDASHESWVDPDWEFAEPVTAHVLLSGTMVWRVKYLYLNRGAGRDGNIPHPHKDFEKGPDHHAVPAGFHTTKFEVELVGLINELQGLDDFDYDEALSGFGLEVEDTPPWSRKTRT